MLFDPKWTPTKEEIKLEEWQKVLLDAANLIEEKGWCQNSLENSEGYCILGAIQQTILGRTSIDIYMIDGNPKRKLYADVIQRIRNRTGSYTVWMWNDKKGRTKDEVLKVMREAAHVV